MYALYTIQYTIIHTIDQNTDFTPYDQQQYWHVQYMYNVHCVENVQCYTYNILYAYYEQGIYYLSHIQICISRLQYANIQYEMV